MNPAHLVGQIRIKNPEIWADYCSQVPATLEPWGAELLFRGKKETTFSGETPYTDIVVIRFPSLTALHGWHESTAYQAILPLREAAAEVLLSGFESST